MDSSDTHLLTSGNIAKLLIKFALPFLCANFLIALYGASDVLIVSYFSDAGTLAATATGAQAVFTVMALDMGLSLGGTILIGQFFGARQTQEVKRTIGTFFILKLMIAVICSVLLFIFAEKIAHLLETPPEAIEGATRYIMICGGGIMFTFLYEGVSAVLRGLGDSKNPLKFVAIACCINIILDIIFVGAFHWGAAGVASATIFAQACSFLIAILYLKHRKFIFDFKLSAFKFFPDKAKTILFLGIPNAIQHVIIFLSFTILTVIVNKFGVIASATLGISNRIDGFLLMPPIAFGSAVSVMVAQNMGANEIRRAKKSLYTGFLFALPFGLFGFTVMYHYADVILAFINSDPRIVSSGTLFMKAYSPDCIIMAMVFCFTGFFNGCGRTTFTMANSIFSSLCCRVPLFLMATTLYEAGLALPLSSIPHLVITVLYFTTGRWKKPLLVKNQNSEINNTI